MACYDAGVYSIYVNIFIYDMCVCLYVSIVELTIDVHAFTLPWRPIRGGGGLVKIQTLVTLLLLG